MAEEVIENKAEVVEAPDVPKASKKKGKRVVTSGQMHIHATFNNTIISFSDKKGQVLTASSAGANGFRGSKKGTAYAAQVAAEKAGEQALCRRTPGAVPRSGRKHTGRKGQIREEAGAPHRPLRRRKGVFGGPAPHLPRRGPAARLPAG